MKTPTGIKLTPKVSTAQKLVNLAEKMKAAEKKLAEERRARLHSLGVAVDQLLASNSELRTLVISLLRASVQSKRLRSDLAEWLTEADATPVTASFHPPLDPPDVIRLAVE